MNCTIGGKMSKYEIKKYAKPTIIKSIATQNIKKRVHICLNLHLLGVKKVRKIMIQNLCTIVSLHFNFDLKVWI